MTLVRNAFVTLAFTAKNHNILTYGHHEHPDTRALLDVETQIKQSIESVLHTIKEKENTKNSDELQSLKKLANDLRQEFDELKK